MAEINLSGHWKGLAVARHTHALVHLYLEHTGSDFRGKFEAPELPGGNNKGDVTGSVNGSAITLHAPGKITFRGQLVGETSDDQIIYGLMQADGEATAGGTLTLFPGLPGGMARMYK